MKIFFIGVLLFSAVAVLGQTAPLTQTEYVKMLYSLQKDPSMRDKIIEALRKRGIDFAVNDGVRGLTRTKAGTDEELRRALDEADRRRLDPEGSKPPSAEEATDLLAKTRRNTLAAVDDMPDFVVKQLIQRKVAYTGTQNYRDLDKLVVAVSYRSTGEEDYRLLSINGVLQNDPKAQSSYQQAGGTSSTGEFVTVLSTIFKPESETKFEAADTDLIRDRKAVVFTFEIGQNKAPERVTAHDLTTATAVTGMKGRIWIDRSTARVLRIESEATDIPADFPVRTASRKIDYDWTTISGEKYLLPSMSDVSLTSRENGRSYETRNTIRFRDYQKYGTEVIIRDDDVKDEPESEPEKKPAN